MGRINTNKAMTAVYVVSVLALAAIAAAAAPVDAPAQPAAKTLTLEAVEPQGNRITESSVIRGYLGLEIGSELDQDAILAGIERLRATGFFESVDFYTRPGSRRGAVVLVVEVVEIGPQLRFGTGNSDLDGWYLIPAELNLDNAGGYGERAALQLRLGYRLAGLYAHYLRGVGPHEELFWGARAHAFGLNQVYFDNGIEYAQPVVRGGADVHVGRKLGGAWSLSWGLKVEAVAVDSTGTVWHADRLDSVESGDEIEFEDLPAAVAASVGSYARSAWHTELVLDTRSSRRRAGTPESGFWGRLQVEAVRQDIEDGESDYFAAANVDVRAYRKLGAGVLAGSARGALVGAEALFPDRYFLGGLYTVRGFPSAALSDPGGDRGVWFGSLEYRAPLLGSAVRPRLAGSVFFDAGGSLVGDSRRDDIAAGAGWGLRLRLGDSWYLGTDAALPLSVSPTGESFHAHLSLGWRF